MKVHIEMLDISENLWGTRRTMPKIDLPCKYIIHLKYNLSFNFLGININGLHFFDVYHDFDTKISISLFLCE